MPNIHVIIPVYNARQFLCEAVDSVLNQPYDGIDIVLVNDGSTDGSADLCNEIAVREERVNVLHQENQGVSAARNAGMAFVLERAAQEDYIAFLDADDLWADCFFCREIVGQISAGYDLIGYQSVLCNGIVSRFKTPTALLEGIRYGGASSVWDHSSQHFGSMFYSVRLIQTCTIQFVDKLNINEDLIFRMQCMYVANTFLLTNRILYLYRKHLGSVSHRRRKPIEKYIPLVKAWVSSDEMMVKYSTKVRGDLLEGHAMAAVYILDMIEEHYQSFGGSAELSELLSEKPELLEYVEAPLAMERDFIASRWKYMKKYPNRIMLYGYIRGMKKYIANVAYSMLYNTRLISWVDKKRYPNDISIDN